MIKLPAALVLLALAGCQSEAMIWTETDRCPQGQSPSASRVIALIELPHKDDPNGKPEYDQFLEKFDTMCLRSVDVIPAGSRFGYVCVATRAGTRSGCYHNANGVFRVLEAHVGQNAGHQLVVYDPDDPPRSFVKAHWQ